MNLDSQYTKRKVFLNTDGGLFLFEKNGNLDPVGKTTMLSTKDGAQEFDVVNFDGKVVGKLELFATEEKGRRTQPAATDMSRCPPLTAAKPNADGTYNILPKDMSTSKLSLALQNLLTLMNNETLYTNDYTQEYVDSIRTCLLCGHEDPNDVAFAQLPMKANPSTHINFWHCRACADDTHVRTTMTKHEYDRIVGALQTEDIHTSTRIRPSLRMSPMYYMFRKHIAMNEKDSPIDTRGINRLINYENNDHVLNILRVVYSHN